MKNFSTTQVSEEASLLLRLRGAQADTNSLSQPASSSDITLSLDELRSRRISSYNLRFPPSLAENSSPALTQQENLTSRTLSATTDYSSPSLPAVNQVPTLGNTVPGLLAADGFDFAGRPAILGFPTISIGNNSQMSAEFARYLMQTGGINSPEPFTTPFSAQLHMELSAGIQNLGRSTSTQLEDFRSSLSVVMSPTLGTNELILGFSRFLMMLGAPTLAFLAMNVFSVLPETAGYQLLMNQFLAVLTYLRPYLVTVINVRVWASHSLLELYNLFALLVNNARTLLSPIPPIITDTSSTVNARFDALRRGVSQDVRAAAERFSRRSRFSRIISIITGIGGLASALGIAYANPGLVGGFVHFLIRTLYEVGSPAAFSRFWGVLIPAIFGSLPVSGSPEIFRRIVSDALTQGSGVDSHEEILRIVLTYLAEHFY